MTTNSNSSNLRIGHLNVRGLERHIDGIKLILDKKQYHFFGLSETKLNITAPVGPINIPGYNFFRHSLPGGRGRGTKTCGGIGLYVAKNIKVTPVMKSSFDSSIPIAQRLEYLVVKAKISNYDVGVVVLYNPTCNNQLLIQSYEKLLLDMLEINFDRIYIVGDFNINVTAHQPSCNTVAVKRLHDMFNLTVLNTPPTRITETTATTIDLLVTDSPQSILKSTTATGSSISDHEIIYLIADTRVRKPTPIRVMYRNFRRVNQLHLQADFQSRNHRPIFDCADVNLKAELVTAELQDLMEQHAPETVVIIRDQRTPWITNEIIHAMSLRDLAFKLYSRNPNRTRGDHNWSDYCVKRDRVSTLVFMAKRRYADRNFSSDSPAKKLWSNLKREGIHNNSKQTAIDANIDAELLNQFFAEGHEQLTASPSIPIERSDNADGNRSPVRCFRFRHTDAADVAIKIFGISTNAAGSDNVPISFVKMLSPFILPLFVNLFNAIIDARIFPAIWKKAIITPLPKISNASEPKDFRPISVLPAISKVLEKILLAQITAYLETTVPHLLVKCQSGYRVNYSTTTAVTKVVHDIYTNFDNKFCTLMVLVDFSLAFNCVKHIKLQQKLRREFGFDDPAVQLIESFLGNRCQAVKHGNGITTYRRLSDGTPQGSCLSALLFSIYINSLPLSLKCEYHMYADDLQIYVSGPIESIDRLVHTINNDLVSIANWATENGLFPNPRKTQAIIFCKEGHIIPGNDITFCGETIALSTRVVNLGLIMDSNLKWKEQVNGITMKAFNVLRTLRRFASVLSQPVRLKLVRAVVMPIITYCDIVYYPGLSTALKDQVHRCFKSSIRFVFKMNRYDTTESVRNTILGHDLANNYRHRICCFFYKAWNGKLPEYILDHLQRGQMERTRSYRIPRHTASAKKSVLIYGIPYWNQLPADVKSKPSIVAFKHSLRRLHENT